MPIIVKKSDNFFSKMLIPQDGYWNFQLYLNNYKRNVPISKNIIGGIKPALVKIYNNDTRALVISAYSIIILNLSNNTIVNEIPYSRPLTSGDVLPVDITPDGSMMIITNTTGHASFINLNTGNLLKTINCGTNPNQVAISPNGEKAIVFSSSSTDLYFISLIGTPEWFKTITLDSFPRAMAISNDSNTAVVTNGSNASIINLNGVVSLVGNVACGTTPFRLNITPDSTKAIIANQGSNNVSIISLSGTPYKISDINCGTLPVSVAITSDSQKAVVANASTNNVTIISLNGSPSFISNINCGTTPTKVLIGKNNSSSALILNAGSSNVTIMDLNNSYSTTSLSCNSGSYSGSSSISVSSDGSKAIVANTSYGNLSFFDILNGSVYNSDYSVDYPEYVKVSPDGSKAIFSKNFWIYDLVDRSLGPKILNINSDKINMSQSGNLAICTEYTGSGLYKKYNIVNLKSGQILKSETLDSAINDLKISDDDSRAVISSGQYVYVVNMTDNYSTTAIYCNGNTTRGFAITKDSTKAIVAAYGSSPTVYVISLTGTPSISNFISCGTNPSLVELTSDGTKAIIGDGTANAKILSLTPSLSILASPAMPSNPVAIAISPDNTVAIAVHSNSINLTFINLSTYQPSTYPISDYNLDTGANAISISPDGKKAVIYNGGLSTKRQKIIDLNTKEYYPKIISAAAGSSPNKIVTYSVGADGYAFIKSTSTASITAINLSSLISSTITVGTASPVGYPQDISIHNNKIITPNYTNKTVSIIDLLNNFSVSNVSFTDVVYASDIKGSKAVAITHPSSGPDKINVVNLNDNSYVTSTLNASYPRIDLGSEYVKMTPDGNKAIIRTTNASGLTSSLDIYDISSTPSLLVSNVLVDQCTGFIINSDGTKAFAACTSKIAVVDLINNSVIRYIPCTSPSWISLSSDESKIIVTNSGASSVTIIDLIYYTTKVVNCDTTPRSAAFSDDGKTAAVLNWGSNNVTLINLSNYSTVLYPNIGTSTERGVASYNNKFIITNPSSNKITIIDPSQVIWNSNQSSPYYNFF